MNGSMRGVLAAAASAFCCVAFAGYGEVALPFEPATSGYRYIARDKNFVIGVSEGETVFAAKKARVRMRFVEGRAQALEALSRLPGHSNYIHGRDKKKWRMNVPHYGQIRYREVWPGIDLVFYGTRGRAEYDFVVKPGADPGRIAFTLEGAEKMWLGKDGDLHLRVAGGELTHRKPVVYQQRADGRREAVEGRYVLARRTVRFEVGSYDRTRALTIDPVLQFATFLGGSSSEESNAIAVDATGNSYLTGLTYSANFPLQTAYSSTANDMFVTKVNAAGTALLYSTYLGGGATDAAGGIAVDALGNAYVVGTAGFSAGTPFPTTAGVLKSTVGGNNDAFVAKFDASGGLAASTLLGGTNSEAATGVAVDASSNVYVTGSTYSTDFTTTAGAYDRTHSGNYTTFLAKLNTGLTALTYSTFLDYSQAQAIAVNAAGEAFLAGAAESSFPTTIGAFQVNCGYSNGFVTKFASSGAALVYSSCLPGIPAAIDVDSGGNAYLLSLMSYYGRPAVYKLSPGGSTMVYECPLNTGTIYGSLRGGVKVDAQGNVYAATSTDNRPFAVRIDATGQLVSYRVLATSESNARGLGIDAAASAYVTGSVWGPATGFTTTPGAFDTTHNGGSDAYLAKLDMSDTVNVPVTVDTRPIGLAVTVDSASYTTPKNFNWAPNSTHTLTTTSPQPGPNDVRYYFSSWSGACCGPSINYVPSLTSLNEVIAYFNAYYRVTLNANPAGAGTITTYASAIDGYYPSGQSQFQAMPQPGWAFSSWSGDVTPSTTTPITVNIDRTRTITGNFVQCTATVTPGRLVMAPAPYVGSNSIAVNAPVNCAWQMTSNSQWLSLNYNSQGVGPGTVGLWASELQTYAPRSAVLSLGPTPVTVIQKQPTAAWRETSGALRVSTRMANSAPTWPAGFQGDAASTQTVEGETITASRDGNGGLWVGRFSPGTQAWTGVTFIGGSVAGKPAITMGSNGVAYIAIRDSWNSYWVVSFTPGVGVGSWIHLGGVLASDPSIAAGPTDSIYVVGRDQWNGVWSNRIVIGTGAQGWRFGGGIIQGKPSVVVGPDNVAYVGARDAFNAAWMARVQQETWLGWSAAAGIVAADPQMAATPTTIRLFSLDASGNIWYRNWNRQSAIFEPWTERWAALQDFSPCSVGNEAFVTGRTRSGSIVEWYGIDAQSYFNTATAASGPVDCGPR